MGPGGMHPGQMGGAMGPRRMPSGPQQQQQMMMAQQHGGMGQMPGMMSMMPQGQHPGMMAQMPGMSMGMAGARAVHGHCRYRLEL